MSQAVLVTGGAGYIGSHTCKALHQAGFVPVTLDNFSRGHRSFVKWGPLVEGDLRDTDVVRLALATHKPVAVIHFAAFAYVGESVSDPALYYENNVTGTLSLLASMRQAGCEKLVFSSTCATYGQPDRLPITEEAPTMPVNPYGRSKLVCEGIISDFRTAYRIRPVVLRYFNASGADPDGELGERRESETRLIPRALMSLQGYVRDFQVFGTDFPTSDGTAIRDYIHVSDLADAHILSLKALLAGSDGGTFNLGVGTGHSVSEVLREIAAVTGRSLPAPSGLRRPGDPAVLVADASKARRILGFAPCHSDLTSIIRTAWRWHLKAHPLRVA